MLDRLPREPLWVVSDKGYASNAFREHVWAYGGSTSDPAQAPGCRRLLSTMALSQPPSGGIPLGWPEGMVCRRNAIRKDRRFIPRYPLPRRSCRLDQDLTGPNSAGQAAVKLGAESGAERK